jgi:hypothetical protein
MGFGDGDRLDIRLFLEIEDVPFTDQAVAYEADADALIGAENALVAGGGEKGRSSALHESPAVERESG